MLYRDMYSQDFVVCMHAFSNMSAYCLVEPDALEFSLLILHKINYDNGLFLGCTSHLGLQIKNTGLTTA